ncbi:DUF547 domain-containing protein [Robiginitalea sediminis]|uniref:DUF547 domain-containing protein n=1 Tax=Robiginitalea sediminis TaxID=1982593 RepID=UPI001302F7CD|nr:DUF547 domain-containing protein [Robiginitalea sediminis]
MVAVLRFARFFCLLGFLQFCNWHPGVRLPDPDPAQSAPTHETWDALLKAHVSEDGMVDYQGMLRDRDVLRDYLEMLSQHIPGEHWSREARLAYYINLYNAGTVNLILEHYPVKSIKDIRNPWGRKDLQIGDKRVSLDDVEHGILRKMDEPRIHFTVNCASFSCPKLLPEAFTEAEAERQLDEAARAFINDPLRNRIGKGDYALSRIFKWYGGDFKTTGRSLEAFLNTYLEEPLPEGARPEFLPYDWSLNSQR